MAEVRTWQAMRLEMSATLERRTGERLETWNARIAQRAPADETELRRWLHDQGVTGYSQALLVFETFGYPDFFLAGADELIGRRYADRQQLRPILDAILSIAPSLGEVTIQARKGYVTLVGPRRTFASIEPTTKTRVDLGLRLPDPKPEGRLVPSMALGQSAMTARISLASADDVDDEVVGWLKAAFDANTT